MADKTIVYVHGAGRQDPAPKLRHDLDTIVFGRDIATSRVAYYADVRWPPTSGAGLAIGADRAAQRRRRKAIRATASPGVTPRAAAKAIVASVAEQDAGLARRPPAEAASAVRLVEQLYRRADRIAARSAAPPPDVALGPSFPDWIFRLVVGTFASDVVDYLFGGWADRMRVGVREALLREPKPNVIVAHSLGTIVLYDVISEPALSALRDVELVTVGSPLGIGNVQDRLRNGAGRPNPVPRALTGWANFADRWDPVALDATLRDEFSPRDFATDEAVNNPADNNHDLTGYLSISIIRDTIIEAMGQ